jgi:hypothetical protein
MKTNLFRNNKLPLLGRGLGGGLFLLCWPMVLAAQNGVTVSNLVVDAGTVTFNVSWNKPMPVTPWSDTVWVFVDYNNAGKMERLPVTSATATAGTVTKIPNNDKGVWVEGNARTQGSFSATVKLFTAIKDVGGACVYGSNYQPVGKYTSATEISFTGTPDYIAVLERNDKSTYTVTVHKDESLSIPSGEAVLSLTDKTGAPGTFTCIPMSGNINFSVPANVSKGLAASFEVTTSNFTAPNAAALTYTWSAPSFVPDTYTGTSFNTTAPVTASTYPVTLTAHSTGFCDLEASKAVTVIDCIPFTAYDLEVSAYGFCEGDAGVIFALSGTDSGATYILIRDGASVVATLEGTGSAATFSNVVNMAGTYTARTAEQTQYCPAAMIGSIQVVSNPLPEAPTMGGGGTQCGGTRAISATAGSGGNGIRWTDDSSTVTSRSVGPGTYNAVTTSDDGCESAVASVTVTIRQASGVGQAADATCGCANGLSPCGGTCRNLTADQATCVSNIEVLKTTESCRIYPSRSPVKTGWNWATQEQLIALYNAGYLDCAGKLYWTSTVIQSGPYAVRWNNCTWQSRDGHDSTVGVCVYTR